MPNLPFLPFALPDIGEEEIAEVVDTLRSGWLTTGPKTKRFEENFSSYLKIPFDSVAVNSATAGLHLALEALGIGEGDEVITTVNTFTATAEVVRYLGADPVFVDIEPSTLNIDARFVEAAITEKTKAIVPVHFAGLPCDMSALLSIANRYGLKVVEDAAHALPAVYENCNIGSLDSDATVFSFYSTKTITTGEGGMIVVRDPAVADRCRTMRLHGINRDVFNRYRSTQPSWFYEVVAPGFKYNMTDIAAAIGLHQLSRADQFAEIRSSIAAKYNKAFSDLPVTLPAEAPVSGKHAWHLYTLRLNPDNSVSRDKFIERMSEQGIGCSVHFIPLHFQPYWKERYSLQAADFPVSTSVYESIVSLPIYTRMTEADCDRVIDATKQILCSG